MKNSKNITIKENAFCFEIRNNYEIVARVANVREAYAIAKAIDPTKKVVVKRAW